MYLESSSVDSPFPQRLVRPTTAERPWLYRRSETKFPPAAGYLDEGRRERQRRDSSVRPIVCPLPSLARSRASHRGVVAQVQNVSCLPQLGASLAPPCQPAHESTKTQINFKQVRRIPRRVMRKDRNAHTARTPVRIGSPPLVIVSRGSGRFAHRNAKKSQSRGGRPTTRKTAQCQSCQLHRWDEQRSPSPGGRREALCARDEAFVSTMDMAARTCTCLARETNANPRHRTYIYGSPPSLGGLAPIGGCRVVEPPSRL